MLDGVRSRAGVLAAAASVTTAFFGGLALKGEEFGGFAAAAVIAYAAAGVAFILILWPRGEWFFRASAHEILGHVENSAEEVTLESAHSELARQLEAAYEKNEAKLGQLFKLLRVGTIVLGAEVLLWIVELAGR